MSDKPDKPSSTAKPAHQPSKPKTSPEGNKDYDEIPVEELIRLTRELTQRITNADRQRLAMELKETGHQRTIQTRGPITLQQFFTGEIDLDTELAMRFDHAPLLTGISFHPKKTDIHTRRVSAILKSQDGSATATFDLHLQTGLLETIFTLNHMLSLRFKVGTIHKAERRRWMELMRRKSGIAFLWTKKRWENDYMVFVVREHFARVYAFSPDRHEAAARITLDVVEELLKWLDNYWMVEPTAEIQGVVDDHNAADSDSDTIVLPPTPDAPDGEDDSFDPDKLQW